VGALKVILRPFFSYYGSKWRLARLYPPPRHRRLVEPFAGSAGYALRHPSREVTLYERNPVVAGLWQYLTRVTAEEIMRLPANVQDVAALPCQEARWLVGFWMTVASWRPRRRPVGRVRRHPHKGWGGAVRLRVATQLPFIRHWKVVCGDGRLAAPGPATWFVDPPCSSRAGGEYGGPPPDYARLGEWCRGLPGQVIVCEQAGAAWLPFRPLAVADGCRGGKGNRVNAEAFWLNDWADREG
jgi:hypothetical protein